RKSETAKHLTQDGRTFLALPISEDMPVLLGVRLSVSFPILLSAIPLYSVDRTLHANAEGPAEATRVLFSDGGICSNFPMHFVDAGLPSRPTFGIDLREFHPDHRSDAPLWLDLINDDPAKSYPFENAAYRQLAANRLTELAAIGKKLDGSGLNFAT